MSDLSAVVLAGGETGAEWEAACGTRSRALVPFHGRPMVSWVIDALRASERIAEIVVVGETPPAEDVICVPAGASYLESVKNGLSVISNEMYLQVTADIPFLTTEAVSDFVERAGGDLDIGYAVIPESASVARFPTLRRTYVRTREGRLTGGNMGLVRRAYLRQHMNRVEAAYAARKAPLRLAAMMGFGTVARLLLGMLLPSAISIEYAERKVGRILGGKLRAVVTPFAEIGADIDSLDHWREAERLPFPATSDFG